VIDIRIGNNHYWHSIERSETGYAYRYGDLPEPWDGHRVYDGRRLKRGEAEKVPVDSQLFWRASLYTNYSAETAGGRCGALLAGYFRCRHIV
jgi:hypothetical protein